MTSERSKRRDFLSLVFILQSISKKLLIVHVFPNFQIARVAKKIWSIIFKHNSLHLRRKYLVNKPLRATGMSADNVRG